jgi:S-sulfo-L-cysteine synthase (3-phospho-L-serine-dependent)
MLKQNMIDCIGRTPLVQLQLDNRSSGKVFAKLELLNPFGMKDRVAKSTLLEARRKGILRDGAPIIESSSGTMALGFALVGTFLGHEVHIVTDPRIDPLTLTKLRAIGCHVHIVEKMTSHGWQSARLELLDELMNRYPGAFWPRQYDNPDNPLAYTELAHELLADLDQVDVLVASVGSGGSLCGTARELRKTYPHLHVVAVDAVGSILFGQPDRPGRLQSGLGNSIIPGNVDYSVINEVHWLNDEEAFAGTFELASREKIFAGNSSGSTYVVARWISQHVPAGAHIVALLPDRGDRYVNTFYNEDYRREKGIQKLCYPESPVEVPYATVVDSWSFARMKVRV